MTQVLSLAVIPVPIRADPEVETGPGNKRGRRQEEIKTKPGKISKFCLC